MDPLSSFAVASSAAQLTDFMFKLIKSTRMIHKSVSGASEADENLEKITLRLRDLAHRLTAVSDPVLTGAAAIAPDIVDSAKMAEDSAKQLLAALAQLKKGNTTVWKSFRTALKSAWNKDRIDALYSTLCRVQWTLVSQLQVAIMYGRLSTILAYSVF